MTMKSDVIEELFRKYYNEAFLYTLSICRNRELAEDIVQTTFFKALSTVDNGIKSFKSWLLTVCRNEYMTICRKRKKLSPDEPDENIPDENEKVLETIIKKEEYRALYRAISLLPDIQREIVVLYYFSGIPLKSISEIIGKTESNTKVLMHRAKKKLKEILEVEI